MQIKDKFDIETVEKLSKLPLDDLKPFVPELLTWLQDYNWPVAKPVALLLQGIAHDIDEEIIAVLRTNDEIWKYWCLHVFGLWTNKKPSPLLWQEIERMAASPSAEEKAEEVHLIALEIMDKWPNAD